MSSTIRSEADAEIHGLSSTIERRKAEMAELRRKRAERRSVLEGGAGAAPNEMGTAALPAAPLPTPSAAPPSSSSVYRPADQAGTTATAPGSVFHSSTAQFPTTAAAATAAFSYAHHPPPANVPALPLPSHPHSSGSGQRPPGASASAYAAPVPTGAVGVGGTAGLSGGGGGGLRGSQAFTRNLSPAPVRRRAANNAATSPSAEVAQSPPTTIAEPAAVVAAPSPAFHASAQLRQQRQQQQQPQQQQQQQAADTSRDHEPDTSFGATDLSTESAEIIAQSGPDESIVYPPSGKGRYVQGETAALQMASPLQERNHQQQQHQHQHQHSGYLDPHADNADSGAMSISVSRSEADIPPYTHAPREGGVAFPHMASWSTSKSNTSSSAAGGGGGAYMLTNSSINVSNSDMHVGSHLGSASKQLQAPPHSPAPAVASSGASSSSSTGSAAAEVEGLQAQAQAHSQLSQGLQHELRQVSIDLERAKLEIADLQQKLTRQSHKCEEQAAAKAALEQAHKETQAKLDLSRTFGQSAQAKLDASVKEMQVLASRLVEMGDPQQRLQQAQELASVREQQVQALTHELSATQKAHVQLEQQWQQQQHDAYAEIASLQDKAVTLKKDNSLLVRQLDAQRDDYEAAQDETAFLHTQLTHKASEVSALERRLEQQARDALVAQENMQAHMREQVDMQVAVQVEQERERMQRSREEEEVKEKDAGLFSLAVEAEAGAEKTTIFTNATAAIETTNQLKVELSQLRKQRSDEQAAAEELTQQFDELNVRLQEQELEQAQIEQKMHFMQAAWNNKEADFQNQLYQATSIYQQQLAEIELMKSAAAAQAQQLGQFHSVAAAAESPSPGAGSSSVPGTDGSGMTLAAVSKVPKLPSLASHSPSSGLPGNPHASHSGTKSRPRGDSIGSVHSTGSAGGSQANTSVGIISPPNTGRRSSGNSLLSTPRLVEPFGTFNEDEAMEFMADQETQIATLQEQLIGAQATIQTLQAQAQQQQQQASMSSMQVEQQQQFEQYVKYAEDLNQQLEQSNEELQSLRLQLQQYDSSSSGHGKKAEHTGGNSRRGSDSSQYAKGKSGGGGSQADVDEDEEDDEALNLPFSVGDDSYASSRTPKTSLLGSPDKVRGASGSSLSLSMPGGGGYSGSSIYSTVAGSAADALSKLVHPARAIISGKGESLLPTSTHERHTGVTPRPLSLGGTAAASSNSSTTPSTSGREVERDGDAFVFSGDKDEEIYRLQQRVRNLEIERDRALYQAQPVVADSPGSNPAVAEPSGEASSACAKAKSDITPSNSGDFALSIDSPGGVTAIRVRRQESVDQLALKELTSDSHVGLEVLRLKAEVTRLEGELEAATNRGADDDGGEGGKQAGGGGMHAPYNPMQSDEHNWTLQVQALLAQPRAMLCLSRHLLSGLPAYMSVLELYIRAVYSVHNPAKLLLAHGVLSGPPPSGGLAALCVPGNRSASDNVARLLRLYAGKEQEMCDDLRGKYKIKEAYAVTLLVDASDEGFAENAALQTQFADQRTVTDASAGARSRAVANTAGRDSCSSDRVGNLLRSVWYQMCIWMLLLLVAFQMIYSGGAGAGACISGGYGAVRLTT